MWFRLQSQKFLLCLIITLQLELNFNEILRQKWIKFCLDDIEICGDCFDLNHFNCQEALAGFSFHKQNWDDSINSLLGTRNLDYGVYNGKDAVLKRIVTQDEWKRLNTRLEEETNNSHKDMDKVSALKSIFFDANKVGGSLICGQNAQHAVERFHKAFPTLSIEYFYLLLNMNIQPLVLTLLKNLDYPVPEQLNLIGFTTISSYEGKPISAFFTSNFKSRLKISKLLLEAALKMTDGFGHFRFYMTDLTGDNIVVNEKFTKVSFVDLDNVIIVDSSFESNPEASKYFNKTHIHEWIECNGCFAYSPEDICSHRLSDINIFAVCQYLARDLYENKSRGFLHDIPEEVKEKFPDFEWLEQCVDCDRIDIKSCDRFKSAKQLIKVIDEVLEYLS